MLDNADQRLGAAWHVIARSTDVGEVPVVAWLLGVPWTVVRHADSVAALDGAGDPPAEIAERYGLVWIAPRRPTGDEPELPEMADPRYTTGVVVRRTPVAAGVLVDNFLDVSHFSYLHRETFGRVAPVTTQDLTVERGPHTIRVVHATDLHEGTELREGAGSRHGPASPSWRVATYTVLAPYVVHLQMDFPALNERSAATLVCQPETSDATTVYVLVAAPADQPASLAEQLDLSTAVLDEDLSILELMAQPQLELSLHTELHTRADRASVEYRRLLSDLLAAAEDVRPQGGEHRAVDR